MIQGIVDTLRNLDGRLVGFKITFETYDYLIFLNQGDEAVVLINKLPSDIWRYRYQLGGVPK